MWIRPPLTVAVLMNNSLLSDGIASRLQEDSIHFKVSLLDTSDKEEMIVRLLELCPEIVIVDALDRNLLQKLPLIELLEILPKTKIIQLNCSNDDVHVFTSEEWHTYKADELFSKMLDSVIQ